MKVPTGEVIGVGRGTPLQLYEETLKKLKISSKVF
jgi:hypothetical protein